MNKAVGVLVAEVKAVETTDSNGAFEAVLSVPSLDRDGEVIDPGAFDPLPKSIPIHINHEFMNVKSVVGRGEPFYDGEALKVSGRFASSPDGQLIRSLVTEGMVETMSVGYIGADYRDKDGTPHLVHAELIEASFVSVPSNRDALVTLAKELKVGARTKDNERLQTIHDLAVANGAACETKAVHTAEEKTTDTDPDGKAAAPAAASPLADVNVGRARRAALAAEAALLLTT